MTAAAMRLPTGRAGQALAVALLVVMVALTWVVAVQPALDWYADRADRLDQRETLARRMAQVAAGLPALQHQAAAAAGGPAAIAVLPGASDAVAGAELQQRLQAMAAQVGTTLVSTEAAPVEQAGAYRMIGLRISVNAAWPVLVHLLQSIETATPQLVVDDLQVHGNRGFIRDVDPQLPATMTVLGFRRAVAGP
jgi:general secretion pathway protein M